jgi:hypothetical protein
MVFILLGVLGTRGVIVSRGKQSIVNSFVLKCLETLMNCANASHEFIIGTKTDPETNENSKQ